MNRPGGVTDVNHRAERHHVAVAVLDLEVLHRVGVHAEGGVGLDVHLPGAAEAVEVVDVVAAQVRLQRVEDVAELHPHLLDLLPVHVHVELRRLGAESVEQADEARLLVALGGQVVGRGLQRAIVHVPSGFYHQLEAAGVAQAAHRRRPEDQHARLGYFPRQAGAEALEDRLTAQLGTLPFVERLEREEHAGVVRTVGVQDERLPRDGHDVRNAGRLEADLFDLGDRFDRPLQRGRVGQLDVGDQVALVLDRDEPGGDAGHAEARQSEQADIDHEHDRAQAKAPAYGLAIGLRHPAKERVEGAEEFP